MTDCKTCSKCGEVKAGSEFYSGRTRPCKECESSNGAAYRKANPEKVAARKASYRKANPEKVATAVAAWRKANPEKVAAQGPAYCKANPEKVAAGKVAYYKKNAEKIHAMAKFVASEMRPAYVATCIGLPVSRLTPELLALKRQQLKTHRLSKQIAKALKAKGKPV